MTTDELIEATRVQQLKRDPMVGWWADHATGKTARQALQNLYEDQQATHDSFGRTSP